MSHLAPESVDGLQYRSYSGQMKALLSLLLVFASVSALATGLTNVTINGNSYSNITRVYISSGGRVIIMFEGGGTSASADKVPVGFLSSWNINAEAQAGQICPAGGQVILENCLLRGPPFLSC